MNQTVKFSSLPKGNQIEAVVVPEKKSRRIKVSGPFSGMGCVYSFYVVIAMYALYF